MFLSSLFLRYCRCPLKIRDTVFPKSSIRTADVLGFFHRVSFSFNPVILSLLTKSSLFRNKSFVCNCTCKRSFKIIIKKKKAKPYSLHGQHVRNKTISDETDTKPLPVLPLNLIIFQRQHVQKCLSQKSANDYVVFYVLKNTVFVYLFVTTFNALEHLRHISSCFQLRYSSDKQLLHPCLSL